MDAKKQKSIYVVALLWAYEKQHEGFTKEEMKTALNLSDDEWVWVHWMFFNGLNGEAPLIWSISREFLPPGRNPHEAYYLSAQGIAAAVDYLELKEAQKSGENANKHALFAIGLNVIALFVAVVAAYLQIQSNTLSNKSLQISTNPQIEIYAKNYTSSANQNFIDAPKSSASLIIGNNFPGSLKNIEIFKTYFLLVQDVKTFEMWVCYLDTKTDPLMSIPHLAISEKKDFVVDYSSEYEKEKNFQNQYQFFHEKQVRVHSILRLRVVVEKDSVVSSPVVKDYYYDVQSDHDLINFEFFQLPTNLLTKTGTMTRVEIINFLAPLTFSSVDKRCIGDFHTQGL